MTQAEKANLYDEYVRQAAILERENSKLKSQYVIATPDDIQKKIDSNKFKIDELSRKLNKLFG